MHQIRNAQDEIVRGEVNPAAQKIEVQVLRPVVQYVAQQREESLHEAGLER